MGCGKIDVLLQPIFTIIKQIIHKNARLLHQIHALSIRIKAVLDTFNYKNHLLIYLQKSCSPASSDLADLTITLGL